jgi:anti-sigma B factor antagonist
MPNPPPPAIDSETLIDGVLIRLQGDIDFSRSPGLRGELMGLLRQNVPRMVIDLAGVPYMDSSGVAVLVEALQTQRARKHKLILCHMQPKVKGIFEISRLNQLFTIAEDVAAAMKA